MVNRRLALGVLATVLVSCLGAEPLIWYRFDLPPIFEVRGQQQGQGQLDGVVRFLQARLTEYDHTDRVANVPRILADLAAGRSVVSAGFLRTRDRERFLLYSVPVMAAPAPRLVVRTADLERFNAYRDASGVDLGAVLEGPFTVTLTSGRSYGEALDAVLKAHASSSHLFPRTNGQDLGTAPLAMVASGRLDCALSYPGELETLKAGASLTSLPLKGGTLLNPVYVVVPRTEAGRRLMARINEVLVANWNDPLLWVTAEHGLSPSEKLDVRQFLASGPVLNLPTSQ